MKDSKLVQIIKPLSQFPRRMRKLKTYLELGDTSPHSRHKTLLEYFLEMKGEITDELVERESVFQYLFPEEQDFNPNKLRDVFSTLTTKVQEFLAWEELMKSPEEQVQFTARAFKELNLDKWYEKTLRNATEKDKGQGVEHHIRQAQNYDDLYYKPQSNLLKEKKFGDYLLAASSHNDTAHAIRKCKFSTTLLIRKVLYGAQPEDGFEEGLCNFLNKVNLEEDTILTIYTKTVHYFLYPNLADYVELKMLVINHLSELGKEQETIFNFLINALFPINYPGGRLPEYFGLFKLGVQHKVFISNSSMSAATFNNIIYVAHQMNEHAWTNKFVKEHVQYLNYDRPTIENIKSLFMCYDLYGLKRYQEVLDNLKHISYDDFTYGIRKYLLLFKSTFELHKHLDGGIIRKKSNSFRAYLEKKCTEQFLSEENKNRHENFINILVKVVEFPYKNYSKQDLFDLLDSYNGRIYEKEWLFKKIESLSNR